MQKEEFVIFSDDGPDVRWVGNEKGYAGLTNWNPIIPDSMRLRPCDFENNLGTGMENGTHWMQAEVDVSIRPGWFYHQKEDSLVKSPERLFEIYLSSVGRGATLLLNVPPDRRGLFHDNDLAALKGFRKILDTEFKTNLAKGAKVEVSSVRGKSKRFNGANICDGNNDSYWATDDDVKTGTIEIELKEAKTVKYIMLQEYIQLGQRVKSFNIEVKKGCTWLKVADGTTIGRKRIVKIDPVETDKIRINIIDSKAALTISNVEAY